MSAAQQRRRATRLRQAFKLARTWRWDRLFEAFDIYDDPTAAMAVHHVHCMVMVSMICTCRPVLVLPPARV